MCFYIVFLISLLLSLVIVDTIVKCSKPAQSVTPVTRNNIRELYERCLCSPLGEPVCSVYTGASQYDKMYSYNNYGGPSTVAYDVNYNVSNPLAKLPYYPSQADKGYYQNNDNNSIVRNVVTDVNVQSPSFLVGGVSQADKGYAYNVSNNGYNQSDVSYGIIESTKMSGMSGMSC
jgi:hypothetical protein